MATHKVLSIHDHPFYLECVRNSKTVNPYLLYILYPGTDRYGYPAKHRRKLAAYGDMHSIICHVNDLYRYGFPYRGIDKILAWNREYFKPF
jgi:hypothetical protein